MRKSAFSSEYAAVRARLREVRRAAGLSQRQVAAVLGVPHSVIAKIESGERRVDLVEFCWLIAACGGDAPAEAAALASSFGVTRASRPRRGVAR